MHLATKVNKIFSLNLLPLELSPEDPRSLNNSGVILFHDKQYEVALEHLALAASIDPDFAGLISTFHYARPLDAKGSEVIHSTRTASAVTPLGF